MLKLRYDDIKRPIHYAGNGEIECKDAMESMMHPAPEWLSAKTCYWWGCAFKYLWRWPRKNKIKDIDKAIECLKNLRRNAINDIIERKSDDE